MDDTARIDLAHAIVGRVGDVDVTRTIHGNAGRLIELCACRQTIVARIARSSHCSGKHRDGSTGVDFANHLIEAVNNV